MMLFGLRRFNVLLLFVTSLLGANAFAADKTLLLDGAPVTMRDVSDDVEINYSSMRWNRALNVWNVEVSIRNKSTSALQGPIALYIDSFTNTSGPQQADGVDGSNAFYNLSGTISGGHVGRRTIFFAADFNIRPHRHSGADSKCAGVCGRAAQRIRPRACSHARFAWTSVGRCDG
jgi:hypothetical protein